MQAALENGRLKLLRRGGAALTQHIRVRTVVAKSHLIRYIRGEKDDTLSDFLKNNALPPSWTRNC